MFLGNLVSASWFYLYEKKPQGQQLKLAPLSNYNYYSTYKMY